MLTPAHWQSRQGEGGRGGHPTVPDRLDLGYSGLPRKQAGWPRGQDDNICDLRITSCPQRMWLLFPATRPDLPAIVSPPLFSRPSWLSSAAPPPWVPPTTPTKAPQPEFTTQDLYLLHILDCAYPYAYT